MPPDVPVFIHCGRFLNKPVAPVWPRRLPRASLGPGEPPPPTIEADDDFFDVPSGITRTFNLLSNDKGDGIFLLSLTDPPNGMAQISSSNSIDYTSNTGFAGDDQFAYVISNGVQTAGATVFLNVTEGTADAYPNGYALMGQVWGLAQAEAMAEFPLLVDYSDPHLRSQDNGGAVRKSFGGDIRCEDGLGNKLKHKRLTYDAVNGRFVAVVQRTLGTSNQLIEIYCGSDDVVDEEDAGALSDGHHAYWRMDTGEDISNQGRDLSFTSTPTDPPAAGADPANTAMNAAVIIPALANDTGTGIAITAVADPPNGEATNNGNGTITYTPDPSFVGTDVFTYTITDSLFRTATGTVTVTVTALPAAPVANPDPATTPMNMAVVIPALANDTGTGIAITAVDDPPRGSAAINAGTTITYTPDPGLTGADSFQYTITDSIARTATGTVNVDVTAVVQPPIARNDTPPATNFNTATTFNVLTNDTVNGALITAVSNPPKGGAVHTGSGNITYTPDNGTSGTDSFTYTLGNSAGTDDGTVTVTVRPGPPIAVNDPDETTVMNTARILNVTANDTLRGATITAVSDPPHGGATNNGDGTITYTPDPDFVGSDSFTYTLGNATGTDNATVTVDVTAEGSSFVKVATPYWTTLPGSSISEPSFNSESKNTYNVPANRGYDLRNQTCHNHRPDLQEQFSPIQPTLANGSVIFGFETIGHHNPPKRVPTGRDPNLCIWQMMKGGSAGDWVTGALGKKEWDDNGCLIDGSGGADHHHYVECFSCIDQFDGISANKSTSSGTYHFTTFYMRNIVDDGLEMDNLRKIECRDFLIDGCHTFISSRPGDESTVTNDFPMKFYNGLIRMGRYRYYGNWGHGFTHSHNEDALFTGPYVNASNRGTPTLGSGAYGFGHSNVWKDNSAARKGYVIMEDCLIYDQGMSLGGPNELRLPPPRTGGHYKNVLYLYVGEVNAKMENNLPSGVTLKTSTRAECDAIWATERDRWLLDHGNTALDGNNFDFLNRP